MYHRRQFVVPGEIEEGDTIPSLSVLDVPDLPTIRQPVVSLQQRHSLVREGMMVGFLLAVALLVRLYTAWHAGVEVDEPIYRDAAALTLQYGYPTIRSAYLHPMIPFLYHPPFFLFLLAGWFKLWGNTSYLVGRLCSVTLSLLMLLLLYLLTRKMLGHKKALIALVLVGSDAWIIFTNQAIYLENSLMILIIVAIWVYWRATQTAPLPRTRSLRWYALAGLLAGGVIIYKQIGGFLVLVILLNLLLERKHWLGHAVLGAGLVLVVASYAVGMHLAFGTLFDSATLDQVHRTLGQKAAPGLNDGVLVALQATWNLYWMFFVTIVVLLAGAVLTLIWYVQLVFRRRKMSNTVLVSWALGGGLFALVISLKSPHYMILWIVPLYLMLVLAGEDMFRHRQSRGRLADFFRRKQVLGLLLCLLLLAGDSFGVRARFSTGAGDALQQADAYINATIPSTAVVLTQNYIGVDLNPQFLDITLIATPQQILQHGVTYMALYWSSTQPISPTLGPVGRYCLVMKEFSGFKDHVEVCKIDLVALAALAHPPEKSTRNTPTSTYSNAATLLL
jgi:4-amino-4-deoxy-L-arabinose transferase-like glycosyltransferase